MRRLFQPLIALTELLAMLREPESRMWDKIVPAEKTLRLHDIRHTVGAILASKGVPLEIIAKVLGHKSFVTTRRYAHLYPDVISQAAKALTAAIPVPQPDRIAEKAG